MYVTEHFVHIVFNCFSRNDVLWRQGYLDDFNLCRTAVYQPRRMYIVSFWVTSC